jgi:uncharacterized protein (TIGR02677 family)
MHTPRPWRGFPQDLFRFATTELHDFRVAIMCVFDESSILQPALTFEQVRAGLLDLGWDGALDEVQLDQALGQLTAWGLLEASQNHAARYATPEEFERKNLQWALTAQGQAAIGGVLHALEALRRVAGLQPAVIEAIADGLADLHDLLVDPAADPGRMATRLAEVEGHLISLVTSVRQFNTQLQRLMREDATADEVFGEVKRRTVNYLREYIAGVERPRRRVQMGIERIAALPPHGFETLADRALAGANLAPIPGEDPAAAWRGERARRWDALRAWFAPATAPSPATAPASIEAAAPAGAPPKIDALVGLAREAILQLLRVLERRWESRRRSASVAEDFRALSVFFAQAAGEDDAHRLYNAAFGAWPARHAQLACPEEEAVGASVAWSDAPSVEVPPVLRIGGPSGTPVRIRPVADPARLRATRQREQAEALGRAVELRSRLVTRGPVRMSSFGILPRDAFAELLDLVGRTLTASTSSDGSRRTVSADGQVEVVLRDPGDGRVAHLATEAGIMAAPDFVVQICLLDIDLFPELEAVGG